MITPLELKTAGFPDARHFRRAIQMNRVLLTHNHDDFQDLHNLITTAGGKHPGVMIVRKDNDSSKDLSPRGIVNTIRRIEHAQYATESLLVILNHWR